MDPASPDAGDTSVSPSNSTLTGFPSWLSMPSFALPTQGSTPDALMALDSPKRSLHRINDRDGDDEADVFRDASGRAGTPTPRIHIKSSATRPRSYHQILEDLQDPLPSSADSVEVRSSATNLREADGKGVEETEYITNSSALEDPVYSQPSSPRKEDTARRHKRFSLPAISLQTTPVTALPNATGEGRSKRFSLVLGGRSNGRQSQSEQQDQREGRGKEELGGGVAAVKLGEILGRHKE